MGPAVGKFGGSISRRSFFGNALLASAAVAIGGSQEFLLSRGWIAPADAAVPDLLQDTFSGLMSFVVPGSDPYSYAQGVSSADPGALDADIYQILITSLDATTPFVPGFSGQVAAILNGISQAINSAPSGPFLSPFANLSFAEKAAVFQVMDATPQLAGLASILPIFVAFYFYSEAGVLDAESGELAGVPLGWQQSSYQGVSDGRAEMRGYYPGTQHL